jgi:hypothetical protein
MNDSTMSKGWMQKTNFYGCNEDQAQVDAQFALDFTQHSIQSSSQWFTDKENVVEDAPF